MVPTGGELTLIEAVGRLGPDFLLFCRSSPIGDVWRDLIDAWHRLRQAVSAGRPPSGIKRRTRTMIVLGADTHKRSIDRRRRGRDRRTAGRADHPGRRPRVPGTVAVGAR